MDCFYKQLFQVLIIDNDQNGDLLAICHKIIFIICEMSI